MSAEEFDGRRRSRRPATLAEVRARMDWWRKEARSLRTDRLSRLQMAGSLMDDLLDAIEAPEVEATDADR